MTTADLMTSMICGSGLIAAGLIIARQFYVERYGRELALMRAVNTGSGRLPRES